MVKDSRVWYDSNDPDVIIKNKILPEKSVVLTFDDGPSKLLPEILDILAVKKVPAIFFWETRLLYTARPWKRVLEEGHIIGTHSSKHVNMAKLSYQDQYTALEKSVRKIKTVTKQEVVYFRPPYGQYNRDTIKAAKQLGVRPVLWRIGSLDWELKEDPAQIVENVVDHLEDGAIILLHELKQTLNVLPILIDEIRNQGYQFTLIDESINIK